MRKSLSLLLAIAMVFSMFSSLALAADATELTAQQKYDALAEKGIFAGINGEAALDQNMNRAQFARVASLILGLEDISATDTSIVTEKPFSDVELGLWYTDEIAAAKEAGVFVGNADGTFNPKGDITIQELAVVAAGLLGLTAAEDAEVEGAAPWAAGYIQALITAGVDFPTNYTEPATRADLASLAFTADAALNPVVPDVAGISSATAVGAKKIEVKFNKAVDDTKAVISVKKGTVVANVATTTYSTDKTSATLELTSKLTKGDYTVTVAGLGETDLTSVVTVADEVVTKVEFTSLNAVLDRTLSTVVTAGYKVENQYAENITNDTTLTFSAGKGTATFDKGVLTLTVVSPASFTKDEKINVSALHTATSTFTSGVLVVVDASKVAEVAITGVYNADGNTPEAGKLSEDFFLLIDAKDQYGNSITSAESINSDVVITNSNTGVFDAFDQTLNAGKGPFVTNAGADANKTAIQLPNDVLVAGTAKITVVSKTTGKLTSFDFVVAETSKVDVLTLSQPAVAVAGDSAIEIPFTAVDQFGKEVTSISTLQGTVTLTPTGDVAFVRDYVKGTNKLVLDASGLTGTVVITAVANAKVTVLSVVLKDAAVPTVIAGVKNFGKTYAVGATDSLEIADVIVHDQYGREISPVYGDATGEFQLKVVSSATGKVLVNGSEILTTATDAVYGLGDGTPSTDSVVFSGVTKGSSTITLSLVKVNAAADDTVAVASSSYTFSARTVEKAEIASYEVEDVATVKADAGSDWDKALTVNGLLANGDKVKLPSNDQYYTVSTSNSNVTHASGKINAAPAIFTDGSNASEKAEVSVIVVISASTGSQTVVKTVNIAEAAPVLTTVSLESSGPVTKESDTVVSVAAADLSDAAELLAAVVAAVKTVDQYGVAFTDAGGDYITPSIANVTGNHTINGVNGATATTIVAGDSFETTAVTTNGKHITFKVIVK